MTSPAGVWKAPPIDARRKPAGWRERVHPSVATFFHSGEWLGHTMYLCLVGFEGHGYYALCAAGLVTVRLGLLLIVPSVLVSEA